MNTFKKSLVTGMVLLALSLTACGQDVPQHTPTNPASVSQSATPTDGVTLAPVAKSTVKAKDAPTMAPKDAAAKAKADHDAPMGMNITELTTKYSSEKYQAWATDNALDTDEGVRKGIETFQTMSSIAELYKPRDTSKDYELISPNADLFTAEYLADAKKKIDDPKLGGRFGIMFPAANSDGSFGWVMSADGSEKLDINWAGQGIPTPARDASGKMAPSLTNVKVDVVSLELSEADKKAQADGTQLVAAKDAIQITGLRHQIITNSDQKNLRVDYTFSITMVPAGNDWLVNGTSWNSVEGNAEVK